MRFLKTAVAVAIAGIASAPMIASADTTLSGVVEVNMNGSDADGDAGKIGVGAGDVQVGVVSEHELNNGLTGYGSLRYDLDGLSNGAAASSDNVYVGVKGGFGDVRLGEIPLSVEYGQVANDIFDVGDEISGGLSYTGVFGPVSLIGNYSPVRNQDQFGVGAKFALGGFAVGLGYEDRDERANASVGASFNYAGATIAGHYWVKEDAALNPDSDVLDVFTPTGDLTSFSVQAGYGFGGIDAKLTYSNAADDGDLSANAIRLDLAYALGGGTTISTRITNYTADDITVNGALQSYNDLTEYRVQLAKTF